LSNIGSAATIDQSFCQWTAPGRMAKSYQ